MNAYCDYTISYRDMANMPRDINHLTHEQAQKHAKLLINDGVIWLEVFKVTHNYVKVYNFENFKVNTDKTKSFVRSKDDLKKTKLPKDIKQQLLRLF